jgi:hypothetical protein
MFIPAILHESKKSMAFRETKEVIHGFQCIDPVSNTAVIDCRIYQGKSPYSQQIIATVWIHDRKNNRFAHGIGNAGGYGYHKGSQAIEAALYEMGISLDQRIGGVGYDACKYAFASIMTALGYPVFVPAEFYA